MAHFGQNRCHTPRPAVEGEAGGGEPPRVSGLEHGAEVIVLGQAVVPLVVEPVVAGDVAVAVGPQQGDQVDAADDGVVLAGPVAGDQVDRLGVGLVQGRIIEDQQPARAVDQGAGLLSEALAVGHQAEQEPGEGVMRRGIDGLGLHLGGLRAGEELGAGDNEVDVSGVVTLNVVCHNGHRNILGRANFHGRKATTA
jgi:hypothetical protein